MKRSNIKEKIFSVAIASAMVLTFSPERAFANENDSVENEAEAVYVNMNIPYADFYKAEGVSDVDVVTSATANKWKSQEGTYVKQLEQGGQIVGVNYPIRMDAATYDLLKDAVNESDADYYFTLYDDASTQEVEVPNSYKVLTYNDGEYNFSEVTGGVDDTDTLSVASFESSTNYGDYEIKLNGTADLKGTIYGAVVETSDGSKYGMRHLENIWRKAAEIAWSSGVKTTEVHGNTLSSACYEEMMGKTIEAVTVYTSEGKYTAQTQSYIPYKTTAAIVISDIEETVEYGEFSFDKELPFEPSIKIDGEDLGSFADKEYKFLTNNLTIGSHTIECYDATGKYCSVRASFVVYTNKNIVKYDAASKTLVKEENATDDEFAAYINAISSTKVDEVEYFAAGRSSVKIVNADGTLNEDAVTAGFRGAAGTVVFTKCGKYEMELTAVGYANNYKFEYTINHKADDVEFVWNNDNTANVKYTCTGKCKEEITESADVSGAITKNATYTNKGTTTYTATVTIDGKLYTSTKDADDVTVLTKTSLRDCEIVVEKVSAVYNKKAYTPNVTVKLNGKVVSKNAYKVVYKNNIKAGRASITITANQGNYPVCDSVTKSFNISKAKQVVTVKTSIVKTIGAKKFSLGARTNGDGALRYISNNTKVAVVDSKGNITLKGVGTARITVYAVAGANYNKSASKIVTIKVNKANQSLTARAAKSIVNYNKTKSQNIRLTVNNAVGKVTYTVSKKGVSVKNGIITVAKAASKGIYKITVTANGNSKYNKASKIITIKVK